MAFYNCKNLVSVPYFEKTMVASISRSAFCGCESLESITLPPTVETIAESAFSNCSSLTDITIPDSVTSIGIQAFCLCSSLTSVTIGNNVTSIGNDAFYNCIGLTNIYCKAQTPPAIEGGDIFTHWNQLTLYVPTGCKSAYAAADYWKKAKEIIETDFSELN